MKVTEHEGTICPGCGATLNASARLGDDLVPSVGDLTICLECGQPFMYKAELKLAPLSTEQMARISRCHPVVGRQLELAMENAKQRDEDGRQGRSEGPGTTA